MMFFYLFIQSLVYFNSIFYMLNLYRQKWWDNMQKVLIIVGPTAVGKTSLSIKLAKKLNGEVISGDSMQVYKHLDIGTAKVTKEESEGIVHHLIDIIDVDKRYSAADFVESTNKLIDDIDKREGFLLLLEELDFISNHLSMG